MEIIRECRGSGQTVAAWCADHNINEKSYYYWLKQVRQAACDSFPAPDSSNHQIVPLKLPLPLMETGSPSKGSTAAIIVRLGSVTLELHNGATPALIENTLKALQNVQ